MAINTGTAFTETTPESAETTLIQATAGEITLPEGFSLTTADYARVGADLVLTAPDGAQIVIRDFFALGELPELVSAEGAHIPGELAAKLAGPLAPGQVAQAGPLTQAEPIGQVENVDGEVVAIRPDGTRVELEVGDPVYQGDVLESGEDGAIGIVLADETSFSMAENGRMVLDEMVYDPGTQEGTIAISIVQGVFTFISGEVAKADPDAMTVITPVATIGIRGTQIGIAYHEGEELQLVLMEEADGFVGEVVVSNAGGVQILNQANQGVTVASADQAPSSPETVSPEAIAETYGAALLSMPESSNVNTYGAEEASADENLEDFDTAAGDEGDAGDDFDLPDFGDDDGGDGPDLGGELDIGGGGDDDLGDGDGDDDGGGDEPPVDPLPVDPTPPPIDPVDPPPVEGPRLFGMDQIPFVIPDGPSSISGPSVGYSSPTINGDTLVLPPGGGELSGTEDNDFLTGGTLLLESSHIRPLESGTSPPWDESYDDPSGLWGYTDVGTNTWENSFSQFEWYSDSSLYGGGGDDLLVGVAGDNTLDGDLDNDVLVGGSEYNYSTQTSVDNYSSSGSGSSYSIEGDDLYSSSYSYTYVDDYESTYADYWASQTLDGHDGDDLLIGGVGDNYIDGGDDDDTIYGASGFNWWEDTSSETYTYESNQTDVDPDGTFSYSEGYSFSADVSEWEIESYSYIDGGDGNDTIYGGVGNNYIWGEGGVDTITMGTELNEWSYEETGTLQGVSFGEGTNFSEGIHEVDDILTNSGLAWNLNDVTGGLFSDGLNDLHDLDISGDYTVWAYEGWADQDAYGGDEIGLGDTITGGVGDNYLYGEDGDDTISGASGYNLEAFAAEFAGGDLSVVGYTMDAYSEIYGSHGDDTLTGGVGDNYIRGGDNEDTITGGSEFNFESLSAQFDDGDGTSMEVSYYSAMAYQELYGGKGSDDITGGVGDNYIIGGNGNDEISGSTALNFESLSAQFVDDDFGSVSINWEVSYAYNYLDGRSGDDEITGGVGDNDIYGGDGNDVIFGSTGYNFESFSASFTYEDENEDGVFTVTETFSEGSQEAWSNLYGDDGDDVITGGVGFNYIDGGDGNDILTAGASNDSFTTTTENGITSEEYDGFSTRLDNVEYDNNGEYYDNFLFGGGDSGNDILIGGGANDLMWGEGGSDTFIFAAAGGGSDLVVDFFNGANTMLFQGFGSNDLEFSQSANLNLLITAGGTEVEVFDYDFKGTSLTDYENVFVFNDTGFVNVGDEDDFVTYAGVAITDASYNAL